jgi:hypothetical protein
VLIHVLNRILVCSSSGTLLITLKITVSWDVV